MFIKRFNSKLFKHHVSFERNEESKAKEIILSYKTIYKNTYEMIVLDLEDENKYKNFVFRHEIHHLWETKIKGIMLSNHIFLTISENGIHAISLSR